MLLCGEFLLLSPLYDVYLCLYPTVLTRCTNWSLTVVSTCLPLLHLMQTDSVDTPVRKLYFPVPHGTQETSSVPPRVVKYFPVTQSEQLSFPVSRSNGTYIGWQFWCLLNWRDLSFESWLTYIRIDIVKNVSPDTPWRMIVLVTMSILNVSFILTSW